MGCIRSLSLVIALAVLVTGCLRSQYVRRRQLTGTCVGACDHYLTCKGSDDGNLYQACVSECGEIFSDPVSLQAFESLYCADAISYIEGANGREPGQAREDSLTSDARSGDHASR